MQVREEQFRVRPNDEPLTEDVWQCYNLHLNAKVFEQLVYTRAVIKEILRIRPPAVFVPQMAMADVQLTPEFMVKKGMLCSIVALLRG